MPLRTVPPTHTHTLQSPFVACGILPTWCRHVATQFPFLLPLHTRVEIFHLTAFGVDRALRYIEGTPCRSPCLWPRPHLTTHCFHLTTHCFGSIHFARTRGCCLGGCCVLVYTAAPSRG